MSKKKKIDLSTELADLIMGDEADSLSSSEDTKTQVKTAVKELDPDPTLAISKDEAVNIKPPPIEAYDTNTQKTQVSLETNKTFAGVDAPITELEEFSNKTLTNMSTAKKDSKERPSDDSAVKEISQFFSPSPKAVSSTTVRPSSSQSNRPSADLILTAEASLVQSDHLRIAQERILELEKMVETLRLDNEELIAAGETLKNRSNDLKAQLERTQQGTKEKNEIYNEELVVLRTSLSSKNDELTRAKLKIEELETRLSGDLKKIRVRERELENRLELIKLESQAVIKNKDEIVLDLKRKIDQLNYELENYRTKGKELNRVLDDNRERVRRTVRALRLALSMLEGDEQDENPLKKAE